MKNTTKQFHLSIPLVLLAINLVLFSFLMEELLDASPPNYGGGMQLMTPVFGLVSFLYIRKTEGPKPSGVWILQALNWLFIIFPIAVIFIFMLAFI
ncbi:hypothetical protein AUC31_14520 [Planococcus rifietoensis]|uniref:Uncharacterized protein n=1 Tax=Planococcus rifietoensis TaxID=200991 RepID=A0A0U2XHJ2_9BACL|nr:hypothetical protein [Planococcus rifietoensis]ALS76335.1 hypothetical protein AUC31_14520 [Planococcus rifietoensis]